VMDAKTIALTGKYTLPVSPATGGLTSMGQGSGADARSAATPQAAGGQGVNPIEKMLASLPGDVKVVNLVDYQVRPARQVLVRAKVVDINRAALKNVGVNWGSYSLENNAGNTKVTFTPQPILFGQAPGSFFGNPATGGGDITQVFPYAAQLNLLITDNKARVLSEPSLMVLDGNEGSMLVGGEIPIPVAQASAGGTTITVEYKPFGVRLEMRPTILDDKTVQLTVMPEVSDLDFANGVQLNGFVVPALTVRRETTTLQMGTGETLIIGGLYTNTTTKQVQRIPLLSKIPILGEFFKNTVTRRAESELVILLEPEIVGPGTAGARPPLGGRLDNLPKGLPDAGPRAFGDDHADLDKLSGKGERP
jgi:pilus assembly protein CpaC